MTHYFYPYAVTNTGMMGLNSYKIPLTSEEYKNSQIT